MWQGTSVELARILLCWEMYRQFYRGFDMAVVEQMPVSEADIAAFERDGVIVIRQAFTDWMEPLREGVRRLMADPSPMERSVVPADGSAPFFQDL